MRALYWVSGIGYVTAAHEPYRYGSSRDRAVTVTVNGSSAPITVSAGTPVTCGRGESGSYDRNIVALLPPHGEQPEFELGLPDGAIRAAQRPLTGVTTALVLPSTGTFEVRALHWSPGSYVTKATSPTVTAQVLPGPGEP